GSVNSGKDEDTTTTTAVAEGEAETTAQGEADSDTVDAADKLNVGVLYISTKTDGGWSQGHAEGFATAVESIGADKVQLFEKENVADTDVQATENAVRTMIDEQDCQLIFATSFGYMETLERLSHEYPDVKFEHCSGFMKSENMDNYFGQIEQARYLSGIVAGYKTESNKIGYVAAQPIPEVIRGCNAFTLGVRSVNPEATVSVKFSMTWFDPGKETETAKALLDEGCDVLAMHQDTPSTLKAAEDAGKFAIGYDLSAADVVPDAYLTAPLWDWSSYYEHKMNAVMDGTWAVEESWGGMKEGLVALDDLTEHVPEEAVAKVEELEPQIAEEGNAFVFAGPLKDQDGNEVCPAGKSLSREEQMEMNYFVEGVLGQIPSN
ncbi:MAG TPA: BMP family ABC transporter substrate-binding protein, partial [Clostridiaceae bacterium]|nr:BMP family ABC transporter substrate-binding protein [Clostridiaceae bacterium]